MYKKKGIALILVVSILAVAGIMAVSFAFTMQLGLKAASNYLESIKASYLAEAGISYAEAILREDDVDIDSLEDKWHTVFQGHDVDNDGDGVMDSKWINIYDDNQDVIGRYAVLVQDETSFLNINIAKKHNSSPLKITEGWMPNEIDLQEFLASFGLEEPDQLYDDIMAFRYGPDGEPGEAGIDDNFNQRVLGSDGIDNNGDGIADEPGEGIDEPLEFVPSAPYADDNVFDTVFELSNLESFSEDIFSKIYPFITSHSPVSNIDIRGQLRKNINSLNAQTLAVILEDAGLNDPFQKAVNIMDACDEDFGQSSITKLYNKLSAVNRGPIGDWNWRGGRYETDVKDGEPLLFRWVNMPEDEYYIAVFGLKDEMIGDVTINGITQRSVKHGEILRFGAVSFESGILDLTIQDSEDEARCYFSYLELYPRHGQLGFSPVEIRGVEGIRINEVMIKPVVRREAHNAEVISGDWISMGSYYENNEPGGGKAGAGTWIWYDIPDGSYYIKLFSGLDGQEVGDVEIEGHHSDSVFGGNLFDSGRVVEVIGGKLIIGIQNNRLTGATSFRSIELRQEPDGEYIELVNLTPKEVNLGGWTVEGPSKEGWPAAIPLGTIIEPYKHLALCVDKDDSEQGIENNGLSFVSIWGKERSAQLHFLMTINPDADLLSDASHPDGNIIILKDSMGHIVDQVEYFPEMVPENKSLEKSDPTFIADSNLNGVPDNWYLSTSEQGGTPGLPNDNDGMTEEINGELVEHDVTELSVRNKNFSSVGDIGFVSLGLEEWEKITLEDVAKLADRLTVFGTRLEAEGHIVEGEEGGWRLVQRASPLTDYFENGEVGSIGTWRWDENDGLTNGYYSLRVFGNEAEEISVSMRISEDKWTPFTPPLTPGPDGSIFFGNIEIGTGSKYSSSEGMLELRIKNVAKTGGSHFDFVKLDPLNSIDGRININTASKKVLNALPGIDEGLADSIIKNRVYGDKMGLGLGIGDLISGDALGDNEIDKKSIFKQVSNLITVHSDLYRITVTAEILKRDKVLAEKKIWTVFER